MPNIMLNRIDFRLVHGQVAGAWIKHLGVSSIVILSDEVGNDPFMIDMYKLAAPAGCEIYAYPIEHGCSLFKQGVWGADKTLVLFKHIDEALKAYKCGYEFEAVNVGQVPSGPDKKEITAAVYLSRQELAALQTLADNGARVYMQAAPIEEVLELDDIKGGSAD